MVKGCKKKRVDDILTPAQYRQKCANTPAEGRQSVQMAALGVLWVTHQCRLCPPKIDFYLQ